MTGPGPPGSGADDTARLTFIGTATTLLQVAGLSILTDPSFLHRGDRAYVGLGISTRRRTEPGRSIGSFRGWTSPCSRTITGTLSTASPPAGTPACCR